MSNYENSVERLSSLAREALMGIRNVEGKTWAATGKTPSVGSASFNFDPEKPDLDPPPTFGDVLGFEDTSDPRILRLNNEVDEFVGKFFPNLNKCLKTLPEDWLCGVIGGTKPFGMDKTVFEIMWQRARDRESAETQTQLRTVMSTHSSRGFTLPSGAMNATRMRLLKQQADKVAEVNREAMLKEADVKKEILLFAEEQALRYKLGLMQTLGDFYKVWVAMPDLDTQRGVARAQAWSAFYSALGNYYNVEIAFEELRLKAAETSADVTIRNNANKISAAGVASSSTGLGQVAQAFGNVAAQSAGAMGSLVAEIENI